MAEKGFLKHNRKSSKKDNGFFIAFGTGDRKKKDSAPTSDKRHDDQNENEDDNNNADENNNKHMNDNNDKTTNEPDDESDIRSQKHVPDEKELKERKRTIFWGNFLSKFTVNDDTKEKQRKHHFKRLKVQYAVTMAIPLIVFFAFFRVVIQFPSVPTASMAPTVAAGDRVLVACGVYGSVMNPIQRGDIVVIKGEKKDLLKRVVALGGDTVSIHNGEVLINGLRETGYSISTITTDGDMDVSVPVGQVFLLGDNRSDSRDSRDFGCVPEKDIVGQAFFDFNLVGKAHARFL